MGSVVVGRRLFDCRALVAERLTCSRCTTLSYSWVDGKRLVISKLGVLTVY